MSGTSPSYDPDMDLFDFVNTMPAKPVRYTHAETRKTIFVVSLNEYHLSEFSAADTLHEFPYAGVMHMCSLDFEGGRDGKLPINRYAGPIVVFYDSNGDFFIKPLFEFNNQPYTRIDE